MNIAATRYSYNIAAQRPERDLQPALFDDYIKFIDRSENTARAYIINLRQFVAWLSFTGTRRPERADVIAYREYLTTEHDAIQLDAASPAGWTYRTNNAGARVKIKCKPNTAAQYLRSVAQFFRWTAAAGLYPNIADNVHAPKIRHDTHRKDALTPAEVLTIEKSIIATAADKREAADHAEKDRAGRIDRATEQGKRLYAIYLLAVNAGLRTIEISRANVRDLEEKNGRAWLYVWGKGHSEPDTKKPLAPEVYAAIKDYLQARADKAPQNSPLFVATGNRSGGKRIATTTISTLIKDALRAAGYNSDRLTAHSLRHTAGTTVQEITGNLYTTQQYMRHANPATTEIYLHNETEKAEIDIAQRLYNRYHGADDNDDNRRRLQDIIATMSAEQIAQITGIAAAIAKA